MNATAPDAGSAAVSTPIVKAAINEASRSINLQVPPDWSLYAGSRELIAAGGGAATINYADAHLVAWDELQFRGPGGRTEPVTRQMAEGQLFDAIMITSPSQFFDRLQLNHIRLKSPFLLGLGARLSFERFTDNFEIRAGALTIMAHRLLDRPVETLVDTDIEQLGWIVDCAEEVIRTGEQRISGAGAKPAWQDVRWTVSLATVAGYLSLIVNNTSRAMAFFAVCVRYVGFVDLSKVSALNFVNGCFVHGLLCATVKRNEEARTSLTLGIQSLPSMVAAQDLMANVWVIGDLLNVMRSARQCYIALVRLKLIPKMANRGTPVIDASTQIDLGEIKGPLQKLVQAGRGAAIGTTITNSVSATSS